MQTGLFDGNATREPRASLWTQEMAHEGSIPAIERCERALVVLAYFIELDGDVYLPLFEKFEQELEELQRAQNTKDRARRMLSTYSRSGGVKAIDSKYFSLSSSAAPLPYLGPGRR